MPNPIEQAAANYMARINAAVAAVEAQGPMIKSRITRELIRSTAAKSDVSNLLAAIVAGLMDGEKDAALQPFCTMARLEVEATMRRIGEQHPCRTVEHGA